MDKNPNAIQNIVIVGGGTAGWMSATYLNKALNLSFKNCKITLIEASDIATVGVGEATIPGIAHFFKFIGVTEAEWMKACNATYKLGIKFSGWYNNNPLDSYWHNFGQPQRNKRNKVPLSHYWLKEKNQGYQIPFAKTMMESVQLCEANKSPKVPFEKESSKIPYAFHLDAGLMASYLKKIAIEAGVNHMVGKVEKANLDQNGFIQSLDTISHGKLEGDLFIDCSGFFSLLIGKTLKEKWISYADSLFVDRAIAIGSAYHPDDPYNEQQGGLKSYTTAKAQNAGWSWNTPLITREGNGYVYSSQFASNTDAETEFRQFLGKKAQHSTAKHLKMRIGKFKRSWVKNCVSIGLSCGFIEPLESTGIALIQIGLQNLMFNFPDKSFDVALINNFNEELNDQYENIRDFIILHYCLTKREDTPFWKTVKNETYIPNSLQERIEKWNYQWPNSIRVDGLMFTDFNYISILAGMNRFPKKALPILDFYKSHKSQFSNTILRGAELAKCHPTQAEYFKQLYSINFKNSLELLTL